MFIPACPMHAVTTITFLPSTLKLLPVENKLTPAEKETLTAISACS